MPHPGLILHYTQIDRDGFPVNKLILKKKNVKRKKMRTKPSQNKTKLNTIFIIFLSPLFH